MNNKFRNIPLSVCYYAFQKNKINELQLFCWLKTQCSGHFKLNNQLIFAGIKALNTTRPTFEKRLNWLLKNRWIGLNNNTGSYHINSFKVIHRRTGSDLHKGIVWEKYDFKNFREFVYAGILLHLAKTKWYYERKKRKEQGRIVVDAGMNKRRSSTCVNRPSFPLPLEYAAKKLNKNKTLIARMKNAAVCAGFIYVKNMFNPLKVEQHEFNTFRKHHPEGHKFVNRKGKLCEQLPDKFIFYITYRRLCKLKQ